MSLEASLKTWEPDPFLHDSFFDRKWPPVLYNERLILYSLCKKDIMPSRLVTVVLWRGQPQEGIRLRYWPGWNLPNFFLNSDWLLVNLQNICPTKLRVSAAKFEGRGWYVSRGLAWDVGAWPIFAWFFLWSEMSSCSLQQKVNTQLGQVPPSRARPRDRKHLRPSNLAAETTCFFALLNTTREARPFSKLHDHNGENLSMFQILFTLSILRSKRRKDYFNNKKQDKHIFVKHPWKAGLWTLIGEFMTNRRL